MAYTKGELQIGGPSLARATPKGMRLAFVWQGLDGRYGYKWKDGLAAAMQLLEKEHEVRYFDFPLDGIHDFKPDVVLYWESPVTLQGENAANYLSVIDLPYPKALLFAGGPIKPEQIYGFDLYFVESRINEEEFEALGVPWKRAFGVNTQIFKPELQPKVFDGMLQATCASWKRPWLMAEALGSKSVLCGRFQETDPTPFIRSRELGAAIFPELEATAVNSLLNMSYAMVNCAELWGGGQRATLEAMSAGVPPIVMKDSPKNREYVEESGFGVVCDPSADAIKAAVEDIKNSPQDIVRGIGYIQSKWTEAHYADALLEGIKSIL